MAGALGWRGPLEDVWAASVAITAAALAVDAKSITARAKVGEPSPRWPRQVAIQLAVVVSDCDYRELARVLRVHHCVVSDACEKTRWYYAADPDFEALSEALAVICLARLGGAKASVTRAA